MKLYDTQPKPRHVKCSSTLFPLYPCYLHVGRDSTLEGLAKTNTTNSEDIFVLFKEKKVDSSYIAHEAFHVLEYLGQYIGDRLSGESGAYLLQWIVSEINKQLKKLKVKIT